MIYGLLNLLSFQNEERLKKGLKYLIQFNDLSTKTNKLLLDFSEGHVMNENDIKQKIKSITLEYLEKIKNM